MDDLDASDDLDAAANVATRFRAAIECGMAPMDALLGATRNVAEAYGKLDELGTLEPGKQADLLVLDADPLADPANYEHISYVVKEGEIVGSTASITRACDALRMV